MSLRISALSAIAALVLAPCLFSQDQTQTPAGGIVSLDDAPITVAKEHVVISPERVLVDYVFRNDTSAPITTRLAFIVPDFTLESERDAHGSQSFADASFFIDGRPVEFEHEFQAKLHGQDVTATLMKYQLDIESFGRFGEDHPDLAKLSRSEVADLVSAGLYLPAATRTLDPYPRWTVSKRYIHEQTFLPGTPVRIQLSYTPVPGALSTLRYRAQMPVHGMEVSAINADAVAEIKRVCAPAELEGQVLRYMEKVPHNAGLTYVDFSMGGEHAWKTPVEDFTLQIATPQGTDGTSLMSSVCWDQSTPEVSDHNWVAHAKAFQTDKNLRVGWFELEQNEF